MTCGVLGCLLPQASVQQCLSGIPSLSYGPVKGHQHIQMNEVHAYSMLSQLQQQSSSAYGICHAKLPVYHRWAGV